MKVTCFSILFFCFTILGFGQNVSISGKFDVNDSTIINLDKSFDNNPEHFITKEDVVLVKNNFFKKTFAQKTTGLVCLNPDKLPIQIVLICDPNDAIVVDFEKNNEEYKVVFKGSNAKGHDLINNSDLLKQLFRPIYGIYSNAVSGAEIRTKVDSLIANKLQPLEVLLKNKSITKSFYECTKSYLESEIMTLSYLYLEDYLRLDKSSMQHQLNEAEIKKAIQLLDSEYNVFDSKYNFIKTYNYFHCLVNKCIFIEKKVLKGNELNYGLWLSNEKKNYNFAPKQLQEFFVLNEIRNGDFDIKLYENYKKKMPNGIYINYLKDKYNTAKKLQYLPANSFGKLDSISNKFNLISAVDYKDLNSLIAEKFKGKAVFIDLWATYCGPCKAEFKYSEGLISFLKTQNIDILYLSIDANNTFASNVIKKWENDISTYKLNGFHYFASKQFVQDLAVKLKINTLAIPRYLLINENGVMVSNQLEYPSTQQVLFEQIKHLLKQ